MTEQIQGVPSPDGPQRLRSLIDWTVPAFWTTMAFLWTVMFVVVGLFFVAATALLISIIQFQVRIIEAKTQSKNFSLNSLMQSVEIQKYLIESIREIHNSELTVIRFQQLQGDYDSYLGRIVTLVCEGKEKTAQEKCFAGIWAALRQDVADETSVVLIIQQHSDQPGNGDWVKSSARTIVQMAQGRRDFSVKNESVLDKFRSACRALFASGRTVDRSSIINSFAREYIDDARSRCSTLLLEQGYATSGQVTSQDQAATQLLAKGDLESELVGALFFDLVAYFRFYETLFGGYSDIKVGATVATQIVIAPIEISFVVLVIICGALGAMLRITAETYKPELFGEERPDGKKTSGVYFFVVGIMCALIVYILAKAAFAGLADTTYLSKSGNMSPFIVAFLAVVSGLLCDEAFQRIVGAGKIALAKAGGAQEQEQGGRQDQGQAGGNQDQGRT